MSPTFTAVFSTEWSGYRFIHRTHTAFECQANISHVCGSRSTWRACIKPSVQWARHVRRLLIRQP